MFLTSQGGAFQKSDIDSLNQALAGGLGPGQVFYVDATNGNDGNNGLSPTLTSPSIGPTRTIAHALGLCVADRGDTVFVFAGSYKENLTVSKNGVTLAGALPGRYEWPDIEPTTGVPLTITGQGVVCARLRVAGTAADCCIQQGNGFTLDNMVFDGDGTAAKAGLRLLGVAAATSKTASEGFILNSLFRGCAIGVCFDTAAAPNGVGSTDNLVQGCRFYSNTLDIATADSGVGLYSCQLTDIIGNFFADKNKATYVDLTTANGGAASDQTGTFMENGIASDTMSTTKIKAVGTGFTFAGNYDTVGIFDGSGLD
jgi:hypothetical protein